MSFSGTEGRTARIASLLLSALVGILLMLMVAGDPVTVLAGGMMVDGDYPNAAAAYAMYVRDGWHWPLGANPNFGGVNIFFSDAAPWFAVLGKAIRSVSGLELSFHGLVVLNFVLFPIMAYRLLARLTEDRLTRWLGVLLLSFSLIMPVRIIGAQHIALGSYWVVLWAMAAVPFGAERDDGWRRWEFLAAIGIGVWSHAYLGAMGAALILGQLLWRRKWLEAALALGAALVLLYAIGALSAARLQVGGARVYAFDSLAFLQSLNWGIVPMLYPILDEPQLDTMVYVGTGALLALAAGVVAVILGQIRLAGTAHSGGRERLQVLLIVGAALSLFAMAFTFRLGGPVLFELPFPPLLDTLYENFRATGRFAGVLAYVLMVVAALWLGALCKRWRMAGLVVVLALALQIADAGRAGRLAPLPEAQADAIAQARIVDELLGPGWSGRVYRDLTLAQLEDQRLLDYLLVRGHGAVWLSSAHGARVPPEAIAARPGIGQAGAGDLVIAPLETPAPECARSATLKVYRLCVL